LAVPEEEPEEPEEGEPEQAGTGISTSVATVTILRLDLPIEWVVRCTAQGGEIGVLNDNTLSSDAILVAGGQTQSLVLVMARSQRPIEIAMFSRQIPKLSGQLRSNWKGVPDTPQESWDHRLWHGQSCRDQSCPHK
jgi:hypothetical protein